MTTRSVISTNKMSKSEESRPYTATYSPFQSFNREEWRKLDAHPDFPFSEIDLEVLKGLNEPLDMDEIKDIYLPLCRLLQIHITHNKRMHSEYDTFFHRESKRVPFVIGIAGSVAVGKSTTARVLQKMLSMNAGTPRVDLVTTDGYLFSNDELARRGISDKKGFPESYDAGKLLLFLSAVKSGRRNIKSPLYSHLYYDVLPNEYQIIDLPDILIVEGINVLQVNRGDAPDEKRKVFVSDFFDFSIYVDARADDLRDWYVERFLKLQRTAFQNPDSFFYRYANLNREDAIVLADHIWEDINLANLYENILPTRFRSDLILEKSHQHRVRGIRLRKI